MLEKTIEAVLSKLNSLFSSEEKQTDEIKELNKKIDTLSENIAVLTKKIEILEKETKDGFGDIVHTVNGKMPKKYELQGDDKPKKLKTQIINCRVCPSCGATVSKMPCPHCGYEG